MEAEMPPNREIPQAVSVVLGILVVLVLALVGGRIVQNITTQRKSLEMVQNNIQKPMPTPFPTIGQQEVLPAQTEGPQTTELPAAGPPFGVVSIAIFSAAAAVGIILRRKTS